MADDLHRLIQTIETLSFKALPALESRFYDGWLLRFANGYTRRANSVNPVYSSSENLNDKIAYCESFYTRENRPTIFKMTDAVYPPDLDSILENRGYRKEAETYVYTMSLVGQGNPSDQVYIDTSLTKAWIETYSHLNHVADHNKNTLHQMLKQISSTCGFLNLTIDDKVIGVALGVIDDEWMGIFDVVVDSDHRGKGYGRTIMEALFDWGITQGASQGYLQVQADNSVATTLYRALGFAHRYAYWYRVKDL